jgi:hypothetical protein
MAESTIPTPPLTPPSAVPPVEPEPVPEVSLQRLDSLLETYLELLDGYTTLRSQLSKQFSDGFFSLARANHASASLGSGRRCGEEGYDERMKAQRRIAWSAGVSRNVRDGNNTEAEETDVISEAGKEVQAAGQPGSRISIQKMNDVAGPDQTSTGDSEQSHGAKGPDRSSTEDIVAAAASSPSPTKPKSSPETKAKAKPPPSNRDPLNWYGILIPAPLRQTQVSFVSAVEISIPQLLNTSAAMHNLESQITRLRIELGLRPGPEADQSVEENPRAQDEDVSITNPSSQPSKLPMEAAHISASPRKRLVQRQSEPRSRILKLDS